MITRFDMDSATDAAATGTFKTTSFHNHTKCRKGFPKHSKNGLRKNFEKGRNKTCQKKLTEKSEYCNICNEATWKYRFKCCRLRFCSVKCYKSHSHSEDVAISSTSGGTQVLDHGNALDTIFARHSHLPCHTENRQSRCSQYTWCDAPSDHSIAQNTNKLFTESSNEYSETIFRDARKCTSKTMNKLTNLTAEQEKLLCSNQTLCEFFKDKKLREVVRSIVMAKKPLHELSLYLNEPHFLSFIDEVMNCIEETFEKSQPI